MRAMVRHKNRLSLADVASPVPGEGQALLATLACGICGSDLHALHHLEEMMDAEREMESTLYADCSKPIIFGHEFCGEILDYGPATPKRLPVGTRVVAMPLIVDGQGTSCIGYSERYNGGFADELIASSDFLLAVPNGLPSHIAALTEPMAVGRHAVGLASFTSRSVALVVGCGPVGLAVIAALKQAGVGPIFASDLSPERLALAEKMGADVLIDAKTDDLAAHWLRAEVAPNLGYFENARFEGRLLRDAVVFECVGVPGMLDRLISTAPPAAQIIVAGVCMEPDQFRPIHALRRELRLAFSYGYSPEEFAASLDALAEGRIDAAALVTDRISLEETGMAFERLICSPRDAKVIVEPNRSPAA